MPGAPDARRPEDVEVDSRLHDLDDGAASEGCDREGLAEGGTCEVSSKERELTARDAGLGVHDVLEVWRDVEGRGERPCGLVDAAVGGGETKQLRAKSWCAKDDRGDSRVT